ncbi:hypothetical protein AX15_006424 [Amanita polypyramis BW_CC]|nr:hypothetical protein AX15_006424 [Amanita polypyramis BW_CC]
MATYCTESATIMEPSGLRYPNRERGSKANSLQGEENPEELGSGPQGEDNLDEVMNWATKMFGMKGQYVRRRKFRLQVFMKSMKHSGSLDLSISPNAPRS